MKLLTQESLEERQAQMRVRMKPVPPAAILPASEENDFAAFMRILEPMNPAPHTTRGWVYLIRVIGGDLVKIGMTDGEDHRVRLTQLSQQMPYEIELLGLGRSVELRTLEYTLHSMFADQRIKGEWFKLAIEDIELILSMPHFQHEDGLALVERGL